MKIGILKADSVLEQFQVDFGEYPEMVSRVLSAATQVEGDETLEFVAFDVEHGQYPEDIGDLMATLSLAAKKVFMTMNPGFIDCASLWLSWIKPKHRQ